MIAAFGTGKDSEEAKRKTMAAVVAGVAYFNVAAERAAKEESVKGPGTFVPVFLDALAQVRDQNSRGETEWVGAVRAYMVDVVEEQ
jgi:thiamine-phosphate diphosphorylase/hydroxyethylthiazole kinase